MDLSKIMTISGKGGLFKLVAQTKNGAIVESLVDLKRFPVFTHEKMSTLEEISVYTTDEDVPLKKVFRKIFDRESGYACIDPKSDGSALRNYFEEILPDFDQERVYTSDIKKILAWYNLLQEKGLLEFKDEEEQKEEEITDQPQEQENE
jgi:hypothetical protein